jgi:hypothetical protein
MDDIEQTTEALERVELHLFWRGQSASPRLSGKLAHEGMVMIGKLEFKKRPGGTGREASLKFNHSLPGCYTGIAYRCIDSHANDCKTMRTLKEDLFAFAKGPSGTEHTPVYQRWPRFISSAADKPAHP